MLHSLVDSALTCHHVIDTQMHDIGFLRYECLPSSCSLLAFLRSPVTIGTTVACPLKCARITTPFSHMQFSHIKPLCSPASL